MTQPSLFRAVLGDAFDRLAPVLRRHYDLAPGQEVIVRGPMDAWNNFAFARALIPFMPVPGKAVPVVVRNRGLLDGGEVCYEWVREFSNPNGTAVSYTLTRPAPISATAPSVLDTFNQPPNIGVTLALEVIEAGRALKQTTAGPQYAIRNGKNGKLTKLPGLFSIHSTAIERAVDDRTIQTDVVVSHPIFGRLFGYSGRLMVGE
jgi:hypothetical protein